MILSGEAIDPNECPCEICSGQDNEEVLLQRQKLEETMDVISNHIIDIILENPEKYLLKAPQKQTKVGKDE